MSPEVQNSKEVLNHRFSLSLPLFWCLKEQLIAWISSKIIKTFLSSHREINSTAWKCRKRPSHTMVKKTELTNPASTLYPDSFRWLCSWLSHASFRSEHNYRCPSWVCNIETVVVAVDACFINSGTWFVSGCHFGDFLLAGSGKVYPARLGWCPGYCRSFWMTSSHHRTSWIRSSESSCQISNLTHNSWPLLCTRSAFGHESCKTHANIVWLIECSHWDEVLVYTRHSRSNWIWFIFQFGHIGEIYIPLFWIGKSYSLFKILQH